MPDDTPIRLMVVPGLDHETAQFLEAVRLEEYAFFLMLPSGVRATFYWQSPCGEWRGKN